MGNYLKVDQSLIKAVALAFVLSLLVTPFPALAQATADGMADSIYQTLTGPLAKTFVAIGFVICGFMFVMGNMQKGTFISVVVGAIVIFSADWLVDTISG